MRNRSVVSGLLIIIVLVVVVWILTRHQGSPANQAVSTPTPTVSMTPAPSNLVLGVQTKTAGCQVNGALQDKECTPGATIPGVTAAQVCVSGYAKSVRNVSNQVKSEVYKEYGIVSHTSGQYEVDHLISLELGGSNDISNLWPEAANPVPGFHQKDVVENYLHNQVCQGKLSLEEAQKEISTDWLAVFNSMPEASTQSDTSENP